MGSHAEKGRPSPDYGRMKAAIRIARAGISEEFPDCDLKREVVWKLDDALGIVEAAAKEARRERMIALHEDRIRRGIGPRPAGLRDWIPDTSGVTNEE